MSSSLVAVVFGAAAYVTADSPDLDSPATVAVGAARSGVTFVARSPAPPPEVEPDVVVLEALNNERAARGLGALRSNPRLVAAAQGHSDYLATLDDGLPHIGPNGQTVIERVNATGYRWAALGETLAAGISRPSTVVDAWIASPSHEQIIMSALYTEVGIAVARNASHQIYWTLVAAAPA